jgi:hypothetical protein
MESDFSRIAATLDRYPNFAVDLTARMPYIMRLTRAETIAFFTKYQDRLIYGTDDSIYPGAEAPRFAHGMEIHMRVTGVFWQRTPTFHSMASKRRAFHCRQSSSASPIMTTHYTGSRGYDNHALRAPFLRIDPEQIGSI